MLCESLSAVQTRTSDGIDIPTRRWKIKRTCSRYRLYTAIAEARTVREEVESKISKVAKHADASASGMADNITGKMKEVAAYTDAQTSRAVTDLQSKMCEFVEGHRRDLEAKIEQN